MIFNQALFDVLESFDHSIDDSQYMRMILGDLKGSIDKSVTPGHVFEVDTILSSTDNMIIVHGSSSPSISINLNKEKEFLRSMSLTYQDFIDSFQEGSKYYVKVTSTEEGVIGSFNEAMRENLYQEFFDQIKTPSKVYDAKVIQKNSGGYFVNINGAYAFLPGSLASANKIKNFEALIGKTVKVMVDSYINESNTFVVSNKKYIDYVMPEMIQHIDIRKCYSGIVTGTNRNGGRNGVFVEFNQIMTGLLSVEDMSPKTLEEFNSGTIRPGMRVNIYVKDVIPPKNFVLTELEEVVMSSHSILESMANIIEKDNSNIVVSADVKSLMGGFVTVAFNGITTTIHTTPQITANLRSKQINTIVLNISSINPERNLIDATIITEQYELTN